MKFSIEIILIIIICIIILFNACSETEYFADVAGTTIAGADIDAIRNLNNYAKTLMQPDGTLTNPGNLNVVGNISSKNISRTDGGDWLRINDATNNAGRTALYGNLSINSTQKGFGGLSVGTWGSDAGEGNIAITGEIKFPHGWTLGVTSDGHLRIRNNGADRFAVHKNGEPMYAPNGLDVGTWVGTGGGTLNVSGNVNVVGNTKTKQLNADLVETPHLKTPHIEMAKRNVTYRMQVIDDHNALRFSGGGAGLSGWADLRTWTYTGRGIDW
jgi:hypothetical protein